MGYRPTPAGAATAAKGFLPIEAAGGGGLASPIDPSLGWDHAFWAEDPSWSHPADGGNVTSWRNAGSQNKPVSCAAPYPTYMAIDTHLGNRPSIKWTLAANTNALVTDGTDTALAQPGTAVFVFYSDGTNASGDVGVLDANTARWLYRPIHGTTQMMYAGTPVGWGTALGTGAYFVVANFNGASSSITVNGGATLVTPGDIGAGNLLTPSIPCQTSVNPNGLSGDIAFVGIKGNGGLTPAQITALQNWAHTHYGFF